MYSLLMNLYCLFISQPNQGGDRYRRKNRMGPVQTALFIHIEELGT